LGGLNDVAQYEAVPKMQDHAAIQSKIGMTVLRSFPRARQRGDKDGGSADWLPVRAK
jgi:hypothetical protein